MVEAMVMGGRIAMLGIPAGQIAGGLEPDRVQGDHHQGRLWPRDLRDLVQDDRHAGKRAGCAPGDHPPLPVDRFEEGFAAMRSGLSGKVVLDWG
jgi:threonine 3-dehydrogenase